MCSSSSSLPSVSQNQTPLCFCPDQTNGFKTDNFICRSCLLDQPRVCCECHEAKTEESFDHWYIDSHRVTTENEVANLSVTCTQCSEKLQKAKEIAKQAHIAKMLRKHEVHFYQYTESQENYATSPPSNSLEGTYDIIFHYCVCERQFVEQRTTNGTVVLSLGEEELPESHYSIKPDQFYHGTAEFCKELVLAPDPVFCFQRDFRFVNGIPKGRLVDYQNNVWQCDMQAIMTDKEVHEYMHEQFFQPYVRAALYQVEKRFAFPLAQDEQAFDRGIQQWVPLKEDLNGEISEKAHERVFDCETEQWVLLKEDSDGETLDGEQEQEQAQDSDEESKLSMTLEEAEALDREYQDRHHHSWVCRHLGLSPDLAKRIHDFLPQPPRPVFFVEPQDLILEVDCLESDHGGMEAHYILRKRPEQSVV